MGNQAKRFTALRKRIGGVFHGHRPHGPAVRSARTGAGFAAPASRSNPVLGPHGTRIRWVSESFDGHFSPRSLVAAP
jgi:hypothetical protein